MFGEDMLFRIPALLIALTIHEYSHARMAVALGDPTPRFMGRLTLNPVAHLDPLGLLMLWLFKFGWAKPVEINPRNFTNYRQGMLYVSLAGPLSNIALAFVTSIVITVFNLLGLMTVFWDTLLDLLYWYNLFLAVFNMIPIPPLDGSKVLASLFPNIDGETFAFLERYGFMILILLASVGVIGQIIRPIVFLLHSIISKIIYTIFIILI